MESKRVDVEGALVGVEGNKGIDKGGRGESEIEMLEEIVM